MLTTLGQEKTYRPGLAFREDWKEIPAETPVNQKHVNHPDLILGLYGPGKDSIKKSHHDTPVDDPWYIWSGTTTRKLGCIPVNTETSILTCPGMAGSDGGASNMDSGSLHIILKLADGTWLVSRESDDYSGDWRIREFIIEDLEWYTLDIENIIELKPIQDPDLSRVSEVGFTDLMRGGGSAACSRLDWIEVYAYLVDGN